MNQQKITKLGRLELDLLNSEIQKSLDLVKEKFGLAELKIHNISYSVDSFDAKISGAIDSKQLDDFIKTEAYFFALNYGLPENLIGTEFVVNHSRYKISRIERKNTKYPIIATCLISKSSFKFSIESVKKALTK